MQKADLWSRWKAGQSLHEIGRALGKDHVVIHFLLARHGGIAPAARRRSPRTLTLAEREEISRGIASGSSLREIARGLQRAVSTVSREAARHGGRPLYRANEADHQAWESASRPKACLLANHGMIATGADLDQAVALCVEVESLCEQYWRARQIAEPAHRVRPNDFTVVRGNE